ncbi:hypothetical protein H4R18_000987 [Coemansia javaensis]|uniref:Beta-catenin-like protein 1 N-terminal domain-containing protein n=1 Tax=Coemansia javaensis TaxID=2761396 RepID=A0A9W8LLD1_9FUNG|nr:hypothetical protein H4R18_000987 [Coemansia javaensis]
MDINDILRETVASTTLGGGRGKRRRVGPAPSLRELKEGGYGIAGGAEDRHGSGEDGNGEDGNGNSNGDGNGNDDDDDDDDDEGGRFFSDGLTAAEKGVLAWVDRVGDMDDTLDQQAVQRLVVRLERAVTRNTAERITHAQAPEKFAESEAELDEALQRLLVLANDVQHLAALEALGAVPTLAGLLAHENADIALDVIQLAAELTAEDVWSQEGESHEERAAVVRFVEALAQNEFFELLGQNLRRLNEGAESPTEAEADRQGVFQTLALVENLVSLDVPLAERAADAMGLLDWLQARIGVAHVGSGQIQPDSSQIQPDSNQQYAAEIASILLQASAAIRQRAGRAFMDALLRSLAAYRKYTPTDEIGAEHLESVVNAVCMLLTTPAGKQAFLDCEGVELLVVLQKQQQAARLLSLKILDYALSPPAGSISAAGGDPDGPAAAAPSSAGPRAIARRYIDGMGLKYLFSILMRRGADGAMKRQYRRHPDSDERAVSCIAWLLRLTERGTPPHWRVLAKLVPSPADPSSWKAHVDRVVELNALWFERVRDAEDNNNDGDDDDDDDDEERYLRRMEAGLFPLQMSDIVLAFVAEEGQDAAARISQQLRRKGRSMVAVQSEIAAYVAARAAPTLGGARPGSGSPGAMASLLLQL